MLRLASIGTGWIANAFLEAVRCLPEFTYIAAYSRSKEKAADFASKNNAVLSFTDLQIMASSNDIDCVYIASPNSLHYSQSKLFLEHGKHVICEKPCVTTPLELQELQQLAKSKGLIYMEAIMGMHLPQIYSLERAVKGIGSVSLARLDYSQYSSKYPAYLAGETPNIFNPTMCTGALMDLGIYCIYPAIHLFGLPKQIAASAQFLRTGADACGAVLMAYHDKIVSITYSKIAQTVNGSEIHGADGVVSCKLISKMENLTLTTNKGESVLLLPKENPLPAMAYEAQSFAKFINNPFGNRETYNYLSKLALDVHNVIYDIRKQAGIVFPE